MKKALVILTSCVIFLIMSVSTCFAADTLEIVRTTPKNGATGTSIENLSVKLWFNEPMYSEKYNKANEKCFKMVDSKGKKVPIIVAFNNDEEYRNQVLVLMDTTSKYKVKNSAKYKLVISDNLVSAAGNTLNASNFEEYKDFSFTTLNQKRAMVVNMLLMVVMMVVMMFTTMRSAQKNAEEEKKKQAQKVNPYKEAKKTGKSVEEIVAKDQKNKARQAAKEAKEKEREKALEEEDEEESADDFVKRVSRPRPISEAGSSIKSGKKAEAERKAREEAAKKAKANNNSKGGSKKKKKKKKKKK